MDLKKTHLRVDASRRDLSDGGLASFVTILVCWEINVVCLVWARITKYKCSDIVCSFRAQERIGTGGAALC